LSVLSKKIRTTLSFLEKILYGSILWSYFLISPFIILTTFIQSITAYFKIFATISIAIIIISVIYLIKNREKPSITILEIKLDYLPYILSLLALITLSSAAICFHTIYIEWDAIAHYIPSAKAILITGGLNSQPYRSLNFLEHPPAIPITYACLLNFLNLESLYNLSLIYFLLTLTAIFLIARKLFPKNNVLTSLLLFISLPTVIIVISSRSLYLDLPFVLYILFTLYCAIKITIQQKTTYNLPWLDYIMLSIGLTLMILTRTEFGIFLAPVVFALLIFSLKPKNWELISTLTLGLSYYIREVRNIFLDASSLSYYIQRLTPVFILSAFSLIFIKKIQFKNNPNAKNKALNKKLLMLTLIPMLPLLIYMLRNMIVLGFIVPAIPISNSDILKSAMFFNKISPREMTSLTEILRWDYFMSVWWLIPPYFIPTFISLTSSLFALLKKKSTQHIVMPILLFFMSIFILWSSLSCDPQPRRLYYFAPFVAFIVTHGLFTIKKFFSPLGFALRVPTYIIAVTTYTLTKMGVKTINNISLLYAKLYQPNTDVELIVVSAFLFLIFFIPYETLIKRTKRNITLSQKSSTIIVLLTICLNIILITSSINPIIIDTINNGQQSIYEYFGGWLYYPDVINYYNENITDLFVTMGFYCHELITFANRSTIDLSDPIYGMPIYSIIATANETQMLNKIKELKVKYFLKPQFGTPFYMIYEKLMNNTILGYILFDNPKFRLLTTFKYAILYAFHENYTATSLTPSKIVPWNYNPETNYTLTIEPNMTKFTATTNTFGRISLMYIFNQPITIKEALWLTVKSYNQSKLVAILFSNLQNQTTDFFSYQCPLTNQTRKPVINLKEGTTKGNFNPNHIEGILIGIETQPNITQTLEIHQISTITYNN